MTRCNKGRATFHEALTTAKRCFAASHTDGRHLLQIRRWIVSSGISSVMMALLPPNFHPHAVAQEAIGPESPCAGRRWKYFLDDNTNFVEGPVASACNEALSVAKAKPTPGEGPVEDEDGLDGAVGILSTASRSGDAVTMAAQPEERSKGASLT